MVGTLVTGGGVVPPQGSAPVAPLAVRTRQAEKVGPAAARRAAGGGWGAPVWADHVGAVEGDAALGSPGWARR